MPQDIAATTYLFSVGADKQVQLAGGNLQKDGETWSFATSQTESLGAANVSVTSRATKHDLFQWDEISSEKTISGETWRVLTREEWNYLFSTRSNASSKYGGATVKGVKGMIILPDDWTLPAGISFTPGFNHTGEQFSDNIYSAEEWTKMENNGAAFLPCGGYGYIDAESKFKVENASDHGSYWTSTDILVGYAYRFHFDKDQFFYGEAGGYMKQTSYYSVRMAKDETVLSEDDEPASFSTKFTSACAKSYAFVKRTLYKDGYFNTLCLPFTVPIASSPLAGCELFTFNGAEVAEDVLQVDIEQVTDGELTAGVPYLIRWSNTGEELTYLVFENVEWGTGSDASSFGAIGQSSGVVFHGFYGKNHITDNTTGDGENKTHYNFFLGANNTLYWPTDGGDASAKMKGFRAHFYIKPNGSQSNSPLRRGMPAVLRIVDSKDAATGIEELSSSSLQGGDRGRLILRDGQILILRNEHIYDITGKEVTL